MILEEEIEKARTINWAMEICRKADKICADRVDDPALMIDILNGDIFAMAQDEFAKDKKMGKYDDINMPMEANR